MDLTAKKALTPKDTKEQEGNNMRNDVSVKESVLPFVHLGVLGG